MSEFTRAQFEPVFIVDAKGRRRRKRRHGRPVYRVVDDFWFYIGAPHSGRGVLVKRGFETDFASIPILLIWLLWLLGILAWVLSQLAIPSALHDWMREHLEFNLIDSDALFLVGMHARRVNPVVRETTFLLVRTNRSRSQHQPTEG